ncbi:Peptidase M23 [Geobacter metallireducens RCH3]|uniref:Zinc metalloendopeptidase, M23 family n=1 Tax=Geobacter metallireducens (strain ATCC 53774 / DSM 7210 / GS-15) TaxID=269799 RepID=Q39VD1_GEOMG|nr:M23 family metallopeptidase [Geobacter metallireducens]ABB31793.1 zinc metalloendopeptidase, M23 family [Geobacter metallireducens GS-15]EHP89327.1 Peptidase M23 [Geobacter metallireducens RCH3]
MNRLFIVVVMLLAPLSAWGELELPVSGTVTSGVGWRVDPFGSSRLVYHRGIDIAVPVGTPVRATRGGRVIHAGLHGGHGLAVIVEDDSGGRTLYGHNSELVVRPGERIEPGEVIARSGNSGRSTGPHVHYEVLRDGRETITVARADEELPRPAKADGGLRRQQEQRMDEIVNSILRGIGSAGDGQGGGEPNM